MIMFSARRHWLVMRVLVVVIAVSLFATRFRAAQAGASISQGMYVLWHKPRDNAIHTRALSRGIATYTVVLLQQGARRPQGLSTSRNIFETFVLTV